jgi:ferrous iron transport protein A
MCCLPENSLVKATLNTEYTIKSVETNNDDVKSFLFSLGFYEGEKITVISAITNQYVVVIKDARYSIDTELAMCISVA